MDALTLNPRVYTHFEEYVSDHVHPMTALRTFIVIIFHISIIMLELNQMKIVMKEQCVYQAKVASLVTTFF